MILTCFILCISVTVFGQQRFLTKHPRLLFTQEEETKLKEQIQSDALTHDLAYFLKYLNGAVQRSACGLIFIGLSFVVILTEYLSRKRTGDPYRLFLSPYSCMVMIIAICMFRALHPSEFIYFAF